MCRRFGVLTPEDEFPVWPGAGGPVTVAPLFMLYDYSFLPDGADSKESALGRGARRPGWSAPTSAGCTPTRTRRSRVVPARVAATERLASPGAPGPVVLVSHWPLLRPPDAALRHPEFAPWCGTTADRGLAPASRGRRRVYGHLHIPRTTRHDGVRFEEVSVGYPREWQRRGGIPPAPRVILCRG